MQSREAREQRALIAARALVDRMRSMYRELERLAGAPVGVHRALVHISNQPGISASALAVALGMRRSAMSHVLNDLAERNWIERTRAVDDQRSVHVHITADGRKLLQTTSGRAVGNLRRAVSLLSDRELEGVAAGMEALLAQLPEVRNPGSRALRAHRRR